VTAARPPFYCIDQRRHHAPPERPRFPEVLAAGTGRAGRARINNLQLGHQRFAGFTQLDRQQAVGSLIDGRAVYESPIFRRCIWDVQDTALADIERIEVIPRPPAPAYGAPTARETASSTSSPRRRSDTRREILLSAIAGNQERAIFYRALAMAEMPETVLHWRVYGKISRPLLTSKTLAGADAQDA